MKIRLPKLSKRHLVPIPFFALAIFFVSAQIYSNLISFKKTSNQSAIDAYYATPVEPQVTLDDIYAEIESRRQEIAALQNQTYQPSASDCYGYPDKILPVTRSGDDLLVLVNKTYQLPASYEPKDLVNVSNSGIRVQSSYLYLRSEVVTHLSSMVDQIKLEGIDIAALSAYRSYSKQQETYNYWLAYNGGNTLLADMISARAGHSQHQLGTTIDFTSSEINNKLSVNFGNTTAGKWLIANSWKYGFVLSFPQNYECTTGYSYEPWHFRYIGVDNAATWKDSGMILELWLRSRA